MRVADNLYLYFWNDPRENNCNSVFIDGKTPLLIDPGHAHRLEELFSKMREDGANPESVEVIICTHSHPDHLEGVSKFKNSVKIGLSLVEEKYLEETCRPAYAAQGNQFPDYRVDFYLRDGDLQVGKHEFEVLSTPGHTPGGLCLYWPRYKVLFSGDTVFSQSVGRTDLPGGDAKALITSIAKIAKLPLELIVPGHGPAVQGRAAVQKNFTYIMKAFASQLGIR